MNKQFKVLTLIAAMGFCGAANAAWVNQTYGAGIELSTTVYDPYALYEFRDTEPALAAGSLGVSLASMTLSTAEVNLSNGLIRVSVTNQAGEAASASAYIYDTLTFRVAGGGSADVLAQMSGNWKAIGQAVGQSESVTYALSLDTVGFSGGATSFTNGTLIDGSGGIYTDGGLWRVQDGRSY